MRYLVLVLLNLPIILLALTNIITQYKLGRVNKNRFHHQMLIWSLLLVVLIGSFPVYNIIVGRPPLDSTELTVFDILQTTAVILLVYVANNQRMRLDQNEKRLRDMHRRLSIVLSGNDQPDKR